MMKNTQDDSREIRIAYLAEAFYIFHLKVIGKGFITFSIMKPNGDEYTKFRQNYSGTPVKDERAIITLIKPKECHLEILSQENVEVVEWIVIPRNN